MILKSGKDEVIHAIRDDSIMMCIRETADGETAEAGMRFTLTEWKIFKGWVGSIELELGELTGRLYVERLFSRTS